MPTYFFEIRPQLINAHRAHFETKHRQNRPGSELAVMTNVAGDAILVKVNCDEPVESILPPGLQPHATYDLDQARDLILTPEWQRPFTAEL